MLFCVLLYVTDKEIRCKPELVKRHVNRDLQNIVTLVNVERLESLLFESNYNNREIDFLVSRFKNGFDLNYQGPWQRKDTSRNLPIRIGSKLEIWNKIMKEVEAKRYAGTFEEIPFEYYVQSPIGLVPKANNQTRLIFHLSYDFKNSGNKSINAHIPKEDCMVTYNDLDHAVKTCFKWGIVKGVCQQLKYDKTDMKSAFRLVPLSRKCWMFLVMCAHDPVTNRVYYFVDKCLPFGASISCSHFQRFSDAIRHIVESRTRRPVSITNCLDDFLFVATMVRKCNWTMNQFLGVCFKLGVPIAQEKTEWGSEVIVFLGILLNRSTWTLAIPEDKCLKAVTLLNRLLAKQKATVEEIQKLVGFLNFLGRAIYPGQVFTRRMYNKFAGPQFTKLKKYHHIKLDNEFKEDCMVWLQFLEDKDRNRVAQRPFVDLNHTETARTLRFYSNASGNSKLGMGC